MMSRKAYTQHILLSTFLFMMLGCAPKPSIEASSVLVTPVTYEYQISLKNKKRQPAKQELFAYLEQNRYALQVHGAEIKWQGKEGKALANMARQWLLRQGTPSEKAELVSSSTLAKNSILLSTTVHQVQAPECAPIVIGEYHHGDDGCTQQVMRWQSMVYPDKKLSGTPRLSISSPNTQ
ncbi:hypothetical protein [Enterovibrio baiacu]|uniref:hypothetical protein n=1 Tax=Enterovibrio baiacu TaxID=2491023 RepID=UPI0010122A1D|nr:hypothetical protein [Enterovibrio baiacu]MBE1276663.1 hypothetical protein [Enterovibrio baiacu]